MRRLMLVFTVAVLVLAISALFLRQDEAAVPELDATSDAQLYYLLEAGRSLDLQVAPGTSRIKLVCIGRLPANTPLDPLDLYSFGLEAILLTHSDEEVWRTPLWFEARRTAFEDPQRPGLIVEQTQLVGEDGLLTDDRVVEIGLADLLSRGGTLRLATADGETTPVLVRPYQRFRDHTDGTSMRQRTLSEKQREELAQRIGVHSWSELHPDEQAILATFRWQRMEARGARGRDYFTSKAILLDQVGEERGALPAGIHLLPPGRALALNFHGPADVDLRVTPDPDLAEDPAPVSMSVVTLSQWGEVGKVELRGREESLERTVAIPADRIVTLAAINRGTTPVIFQASTDDTEVLFAETVATFDPRSRHYRISPDIRISRLWRIGPGHDPLEYELRASPRDRLRIQARGDGTAGSHLRAELLDEEGAVVETMELEIDGATVPFDELRSAAPDAEPIPAGQLSQGELWYGSRAHRLRLDADVPVDVDVEVPFAVTWPGTVAEEPYRIQTDRTSLRFEPLEQRAWTSLRPMDQETLSTAGRETLLVAQVRLEPTDDGVLAQLGDNILGWREEGPRRTGIAWFPEGTPHKQRLLERWTPQPGDRTDRWPASARTRLPIGDPTRLRLADPQSPGTRMRIHVWVDDPALLGTEVTLRVDGQALAVVPLTAAQLERSVGPIPVGEHEVLVEAAGPGLMVLVDRPGTARAEYYRIRTVFRLTRDAPLSSLLPVINGREALYMLPYYELAPPRNWPHQAATCTVSIGGERGRRSGVLVERTTPLSEQGILQPIPGAVGFLADRSHNAMIAAEPIAVGVGGDLAGGDARITLQRHGTADAGSEPVWVRFVALGVDPQRQVAGTQWLEEVGYRSGSFAWADPFSAGPPLAELVEKELADPKGTYQPPTEGALAPARELGWQLLGAARKGAEGALPELAARAQELGFQMDTWRVGGERFVVLGEEGTDGRGLLILRFGGADSPLFLQAPHAFHDEDTGTLATILMASSSFRALQLNTRHRYAQGRTDEGGGQAITDLAHRDDSWFHALTLGLLDGHERPLLVQIHGFGRQTVEDTAIDMVLSGGLRPRPEVLQTFVSSLTGEARVAVYPEDIDVLGAMTNRQGRAVAAHPGGTFLHVEMSPEMRGQLMETPASRQALIEGLRAAVEAHRVAGREAMR